MKSWPQQKPEFMGHAKIFMGVSRENLGIFIKSFVL